MLEHHVNASVSSFIGLFVVKATPDFHHNQVILQCDKEMIIASVCARSHLHKCHPSLLPPQITPGAEETLHVNDQNREVDKLKQK